MDANAEATLTEHNEQIAGTQTFWRSAPAPGREDQGEAPVIYVHGVPTNGDDWTPFLKRTGGYALDLPGFGRSGKPRHFEYSISGYNAFLQAFIGRLELDRFSLVVHDWGGLALVTASELADRVDRVVVINAVPLMPGYKWHRVARLWRTPALGEFIMGITTKSLLRVLGKESRPSGEPWPPEMLDSVWRHFDEGTQRAILRLYRSAPPEVLAAAGEGLGAVEAKALILWGEHDPYIAPAFAQRYADVFPNSSIKYLPQAGHWPWIDDPEAIDAVTEFLLSGMTAE